MQSYILTGATGPIGQALVKKILTEGSDVTILTSNPTKAKRDFSHLQVNIIHCAQAQYSSFELPDRYDVFIHMAWQGGSDRTNVHINHLSSMYAVDAVELAHRLGCKKFVGAGSQAEFGPSLEPLREDSPCRPVSPFGASKLAAFYGTTFRASQLLLSSTWLRILSVYGPYDRSSSLISYTIQSLIRHETPSFGAASHLWDYIFAGDAANAIFEASKTLNNKNLYVLGSGTASPLRIYIQHICDYFSYDPSRCFSTNRSINPINAAPVTCDMSAFMRDHEWKPLVSFRDGIKETIEHQRHDYA